jgi:hypothetical protein
MRHMRRQRQYLTVTIKPVLAPAPFALARRRKKARGGRHRLIYSASVQCGLALVGRPGTPGFDCRQRAPSMESQSPSAMRVAPIWPAARRRPPPIRHSSRRKASPSAARSARRGPCSRPWRSARQRLRQSRRHRPCRYPASPESPARLRTHAFRARRIEGTQSPQRLLRGDETFLYEIDRNLERRARRAFG